MILSMKRLAWTIRGSRHLRKEDITREEILNTIISVKRASPLGYPPSERKKLPSAERDATYNFRENAVKHREALIDSANGNRRCVVIRDYTYRLSATRNITFDKIHFARRIRPSPRLSFP